MKFKFQGREIYMDGYLNTNLSFLKEAVKKDWDDCILGDGPEGSGKSVLFQQVAAFLDPTFCLDRIVFTPRGFHEAIKKAEKYQAVLYDEAYGGFASRSYFSEVNRSLVSMLTQIRQKNLHVLILSPNFFEIERYVSLWRSRALISVYVGKGWQRGFFSFYSYDRKKLLYVKGKKTFQYCVGPNFRGRFTAAYVVDEKAYREKKLAALVLKEKVVRGLDRYKEQRDVLIRFMAREGYKQIEIAGAMHGTRVKVDNTVISEIINREGRKGGNI